MVFKWKSTVKRTDVTYGQLDQALRSLGFTCRVTEEERPARIYEHPHSLARIALPAYPMKDKVLDYHLVIARIELDNFGIATPAVFAAELQKAG